MTVEEMMGKALAIPPEKASFTRAAVVITLWKVCAEICARLDVLIAVARPEPNTDA